MMTPPMNEVIPISREESAFSFPACAVDPVRISRTVDMAKLRMELLRADVVSAANHHA